MPRPLALALLVTLLGLVGAASGAPGSDAEKASRAAAGADADATDADAANPPAPAADEANAPAADTDAATTDAAQTGVAEEAAGPGLDEGGIPQELLDIARAVADRPVGERMAAISEPLLDTPYLNDPAGEGALPDLDPPVRYDAFDCLTFVEEVLALSLPPDPLDAPWVRQSLRYGEGVPVSYQTRNHFMLEQWIPRAIENGWLEDITAEIGETHLLTKRVTPKTWAWWKKRELFHLTDDELPTGDYALQVLPTGAARDALDRIPDGALILTVRESRGYVPIVVTHLGFKVPSKGHALMRHATRMGKIPRVRNVRLAWYLEHIQWYHYWPIAGIAVLMPREYGPRRSRLIVSDTR